MYKHFKFKKFMKKSGMLIPIELNKKFPIKIKRIFIIYGKKNYIRGDHAHKKCSQFFIPIFGKIVVGSSDPYEYLVSSIDKFYDQYELVQLMNNNKFSNVQFRNLSNGISAIHSGWKI